MDRFKSWMLAGFVACFLGMFVVSATAGGLQVEKTRFGQTEDGRQVDVFRLTNANGVEARIMEYGGILVSLEVPDRDGDFDDVVLGFDDLEGYLEGHPYFGCIVGRYANRIGGGSFALDGETYQLATNNGPNHLHGGNVGFDKRIWSGHAIRRGDAVGVEFSYFSPDGEENYPGNLAVTVTYTLNNRNELRIDYSAITDEKTVVNLTHHSYFNLEGAGRSDILDHRVMINADQFTPVDDTLIPTGELRSVRGTPMDFRRMKPIGARINDDYTQLTYGRGYDHNWVLNHPDGIEALDVRVYEPDSGRAMEVYTSDPGIQFYTGNFLDGTIAGKDGRLYQHRYGFALEPQHFPDSPNKPQFPSTVLEPGEKYTKTTIYRFLP